MPRKKRHGKGTAGASKHAKHAKNARPSPGEKGSRKVDNEETRMLNLQQLQEMFEGKLDAVLVHMIMEDCNYNVEVALETLFKLAGDAPNPEGATLNQLMGIPKDLVSYSDSDSDDSSNAEDFANDFDDGVSGETVAGAGTEAQNSKSAGVGLDDIALPHGVRGLDTAISMAKDLDRNSFSEESVQKVTAGLMAYRDTGDKAKLMQLGHLSAVAEMVLEAGKKEEKQREEKQRQELQRDQILKVRVKAPHSHLPVYSATDDRLVGRLSSSSDSSPSHSGDEKDSPARPHAAVNGKSMLVGTQSWCDTLHRDHRATTLQKRTSLTELDSKSQEKSSLNNGDSVPSTYHSLRSTTMEQKNNGTGAIPKGFQNRTPVMESNGQKSHDIPSLNNEDTDRKNTMKNLSSSNAEVDMEDSHRPTRLQKLPEETSGTSSNESAETLQEAPSLNNGDQVPSSSQPLSNSSKSSTPSNTTENQQEETASVRPKARRVTFWNNLTTEQDEETGDASEEDLEKDHDKHISFQEDSEDFRDDRSERSVGQNKDTNQRSNLVKSQHLPKSNNSTERSNTVFPPGRKQDGNRFYVERPLHHEKGHMNMNMPQMPSANSQHRPSGHPQGFVQLGSSPYYAQYSPVNVSKAPTNLYVKNTHRPYATFVPGFSVGTTHFYVKNISPTLLPRTYHKEGHPPPKVNQGYSRAFYAEMPPGTTTGPYPPHDHFGNVLGFQGPHMGSPPVPRTKVTITEVTESTEEPVTATNTHEESSGPPRWPVIHTNLKRNEYPAKAPRSIPPLPPGKVLCLMRGCPGSGKSTIAKSLKGEGVILSTDDFFMINGKYVFDGNLVGEAHEWNQKRAAECLKKGTSPIIIDNTNIMSWEMKPYVAMALKHHYQAVIREVDTPWKNKAGELAKRNQHGVPKIAIERMLQRYIPNLSIESIMNGPDKKKTPEYVAQLNQADQDRPGEDGSPRKMTVNHHPAENGRLQGKAAHQGNGVRRAGEKNPEKIYQEDDNLVEDGWETVGGHRRRHDGAGLDEGNKVNHWNQQRGGRGGKKDLNQRNNLKSGSPRRYNNEHPANRRHHSEANHIPTGAVGMSELGSQSSANRTHSPSNLTKTSGTDGDEMRRDGVKHEEEGWITPPKRGRRLGGSHSPSPNRGYRSKRNGGASHEGGENADFSSRKPNQHSSLKSQEDKLDATAIQFLESDASVSQDPMKRLMNDIGLASSKEASLSREVEEATSRIEKDERLLKNNALQKDRLSPIDQEHSPAQSDMPRPISQEIVQEVALEKAIALHETLLQNTQLSVSDKREETTSSSSSSSLHLGSAPQSTEETYGMLIADNLGSNIDSSIRIPGKIDIHAEEQDVSLHNSLDEGRDKESTKKKTTECNDIQTSSDKPVKQFDTEENVQIEVQNSGPKSEGEAKELHWSCHTKVLNHNSDQEPCLTSTHIDEQSVSVAGVEVQEVSPQMQEGDIRSTSRCQSKESSRAPTPSPRRTSRRLSGGKSRRFAPVFTLPTSTTPPEDVMDWTKYDPSRNIPKPTFPKNVGPMIATPREVCDRSASTDGQDFSFLQRLVSGTMDSSDLPPGYVCRTAIALPLKSDKEDNEEEEIPMTVKLHKGCMTEEIVEEPTPEDEKVSIMQVFFPSSSTQDLKSLLETCSGNVEMATNLLLDSITQAGAGAAEEMVIPTEEVSANTTGTSLAAPDMSPSEYDIQDAERSTAENIPQEQARDVPTDLLPGSDICLQKTEDVVRKTEGDLQPNMESANGFLDNLDTAQRMEGSNVIDHRLATSRHDSMDRFASELDQATQIVFNSDLKNLAQQASGTVHSNSSSDLTPKNVADEIKDTLEADGQNSNDNRFHRQEIQTEEVSEDTDSDDFEEFTNDFYSGATKVKQKSSSSSSAVISSVDELPSLESFKEDRQMLQLVAASNSPNNAVQDSSAVVEKPFVHLNEPVVDSTPPNNDRTVTNQNKDDPINPTLHSEETVVQKVTDQPESVCPRMNEGSSSNMEKIPESKRVDDEGATSAGASCAVNERADIRLEGEADKLSQGRDPNQSERKPTACPTLHSVTNQSKSNDVDRTSSDAPSSEDTQGESMSDSDMPWKSSYRNVHPGLESGAVDPSEKFQESGEGVYDYLGGMVLQMDAAFALQLQELFGQVGFHLDPDMLSADDLKVKIGYQVAKQLHSAWSNGLEERFQSQEKQVEEMLQRDEELARRLQQEENLKKLAKAHRDKKPAKFSSPGSPKRSKKRQKETTEAGASSGSQDGMRGEQLLVGAGLRSLQELGGVEPGMHNPPPVQRMEVPELAQIMAEEQIRQEREKKGLWNRGSPEKANTIATKMKRDQLFEAFPDVDKKALDDIFRANDYDLESTKWEVNAVYREPSEPVKDVFSPEALKEMEKRGDQSPLRTKVKVDADCPDGQFQSTEQPDYEDYRAEATLHFKQRDECFKKAAKAYHSGQKELALYYSNQGRLHSMKLKEANRRAAEVILVQRKHETGENKLDLHNLHVEEALQALQEVLYERKRAAPSPGQHRYLEVVTGRGRHSQGGVAKLKPAIAKFLEQRGYKFSAPNPGCLKVYFS